VFSIERLTELTLDVLAAIAIVIVMFWAAKFVKGRINKIGLKHEELDNTLFLFLGKIAYFLVLIFGGTVILGRFGIPTTSIVALLGAAGLAIGLALQGTLSNFAAGVMMIVFRPFKVGDYISVSGASGTVVQISIFTTELVTPDNVQIIVPNGQIWGSAITNYSAHETRRVDFVFGVSYDADLKKTDKILQDLLKSDPRIHQDPAPFVKIGTLNDSSVDFTIRVWCSAADYWDIKFDTTRSVKDAFDKNGIDIPFPTRMLIQNK
jgi:small conductance mechanosensitive channel